MEIALTERQAEYIREANHRWNFAIGAVRSGKSYIALQYVIPQALLERKGKKGLNFILGASYGNIIRNVIEPMEEIWGDELIDCKRSTGIARIFGEKVYLLGADNKRAANRLRGSEIKFCYCDEVCDINKETFDMLASRLSLPYSVCHAAANPAGPTHYIKQFLDKAKEGADIYSLHWTLWDNPFLPEEYVRNLEVEYKGTVYYRRYILGEWAKAEGLIWPMYDTVIEKAPDDIRTSEIVVSLDYGTMNPFAALLWERKGNVWYATKGYYYSGKDSSYQKTDQDYCNDIELFLDKVINDREELEKRTNMPQPKIRMIVDPSAASFITLMKRKPWCRVIGADNNVADGIRETATVMQRGLIRIDPSIKEWEQEAGGYVWSDKGEFPVKEDDHYMDATRYFVKTMKLVKPKNEYKPLWN